MSISAIVPSGALSQANDVQNINQQRRTEFQQLTQALQSAEVASTQQALGALTKGATSSGLQNGQLAPDLNTPGTALQSGDLAGARDAYLPTQHGLRNWHSMAAHHHRPQHEGSRLASLTSGLPGDSGSSDTIAGSPNEVFEPVNLTA